MGHAKTPIPKKRNSCILYILPRCVIGPSGLCRLWMGSRWGQDSAAGPMCSISSTVAGAWRLDRRCLTVCAFVLCTQAVHSSWTLNCPSPRCSGYYEWMSLFFTYSADYKTIDRIQFFVNVVKNCMYEMTHSKILTIVIFAWYNHGCLNHLFPFTYFFYRLLVKWRNKQ